MIYPIEEVVPELKKTLQQSPVVLLQAPPGAGKSTILPLQLIHEPWLAGKKMILLEPRRLAARSVAFRMASLLGEEVGNTVGYRIRFENCVSAATRIEVVTEGILTRMIQTDMTLENVGLILFDEFHERSLQADLALALSYQVQKELRDDLRLLIMSATLESSNLSGLLNNAPVITSVGRQFPVTIKYVTPTDDQLAKNIFRAIRLALKEQSGDMLVFLPGAGDIMRVQTMLEEEIGLSALIYPLYGDLPFVKQQQAIVPDASGRRKIILATSIAETSLTIEGITTVIDSGFSRIPRYNVRTGLTRLETVQVTNDAAEQRAGRAGRLGPGVCYRIWSERTHHQLQPARKPEIMEADLASLMLELSAWGVQKVEEMKWMTMPPKGAVQQAIDLLRDLDALDTSGKITDRGKRILQLPTHPRIAHMLLEAKQDNLMGLACDVAAVLEERDPLPRDAGVDVTLRVEALRKNRKGERVNADRNVLERIERLSQAWRAHFKIQAENTPPVDTQIGLLLAAAYPDRIAKQAEKNGHRYKLSIGKTVTIPMHDSLVRESLLAIAQMDIGFGEGKVFLASPVHESDLFHLAVEREVVKWDADRGMVVGTVEKSIGALLLASKPLAVIPEPKRLEVLTELIRVEGLKVLGWTDAHQQWQARVLSLRKWRPQEAWPDVSDQNLLHTLGEWLFPYLGNVYKKSELSKLPISEILNGLLSWDQQSKLQVFAPAKLEVPSGSFIGVTYYTDGRAPEMAVRLQEVFGWVQTPSVNEGKTKILLHLLSPGYKPVQVTQDLRNFWNSTYAEVRKELRTRYPKHSWPEDPWTAQPVRGVKRKS